MPAAFEYALTPRYSDLDPMGHVNNAAYLAYLEEARVAFFRAVHGSPRLPKWPFVLKHVEIEYERAVEFGDAVVVAVTVQRWGSSSFTFAYEGRVGDAVAFRATTVQVYLDAATGRPKPLPDDFRNRVEALLTDS